jgi:hypothetical protein
MPSSPSIDERELNVARAALRDPKLHAASATVGDLTAFFDDDHAHMALLVGNRGELLATVVGADLVGADQSEPALPYGTLEGRVVRPHDDPRTVREEMVARGARRLAVVDERGALVGLLCLKRHARGFCSDADVRSRSAGGYPRRSRRP